MSSAPGGEPRESAAFSVDLRGQLRRQLLFLTSACAAFDSGIHDEGVRIAIALRVLFHNKGRSVSLLQHLGAPPIQMLTTTRGIGKFTGGWIPSFYDGLFLTHDREGRADAQPKLDQGSYRGFVPIAEWWNGIVFIVSRMPFTRQRLVLEATEKVGGAHVDESLSSDHAQLRAPGTPGSLLEARRRVIRWDGAPVIEAGERVLDAQLMCLRQIGYEVLNSPDLLRLGEDTH